MCVTDSFVNIQCWKLSVPMGISECHHFRCGIHVLFVQVCKIRSATLKGVTVLLAEDGQAMLKSRAALPMAAVKDQLLSKIKENEVVVVGGETGCGKTTQVCIHILV